jgi:hypothetical protein
MAGLDLWLFHAMTFGEITFVVLYAIVAHGGNGRQAWWQSAVGRALMTISVGLALLLILSVVGYWTNYQTPQWLTTLGLVIITVGIYERLFAFARLAARGKRGQIH